ncbi:hypothetical protein BD408DRAFT_416331 [Parasitella parasitica]|nr:hypothetical protein BD408DRAFT_416331 [Parasitella parasitica]
MCLFHFLKETDRSVKRSLKIESQRINFSRFFYPKFHFVKLYLPQYTCQFVECLEIARSDFESYFS